MKKLVINLIKLRDFGNKQVTMHLYKFVTVLFMLTFAGQVEGQSTTVFYDNFNRSTANLFEGGEPVITWTPVTTNGAGTLTTYNNVFRIMSGIGTANTGSPGRTYMTGPLSSYHPAFNNALTENTGDITWTFNVRNFKTQLNEFALGNDNYGTAVVLAANNADLLAEGTHGYALVFLQISTTNRPNPRLVRFTNGLGANANFTNIVGPDATFYSANHYLSYKVVYSPVDDSWKLFYRFDGLTTVPATPGASFKDPAVEDEATGYYTQLGTSVVDNTYTDLEMAVCGFFYNHGNTATSANSVQQFDNFKVEVAAEAQSIDATLSDLQVSLDGTNFETLTMFNSTTKTYQYYLTKGHAIPTVSATKNDPAASDPIIVQATNLNGTQAERTATVTVTAEDNSFVEVYSIEFIETDYIFISGLGNRDGGVDGFVHNNLYFYANAAFGNNKFQGKTYTRLATNSTYSSLQLPQMTEIGTLDFYIRKNNVDVEGNIKVSYKKDDNDWTVVTDLGDENSLEFVKKSVFINQRADIALLVRIEITKNGDVVSDAGYYLDDFAYTASDIGTANSDIYIKDFKVRSIEGGIAVEAREVQVDVYTASGLLLQSARVQGMHEFKNLHPGVYFIQVLDGEQRKIVKYLMH